MPRLKGALSITVILGLGTLSCGGGKPPPTHYYVLDLPRAPIARAANPLPYSVVVMPFRASKMLKRDRIVYRPTREQVGYYEYHRWAEDPREAVAVSLIRLLKANGTFQQAIPFDGRTKADYILRGRIARLEEVDFETGVKVYCEISVELVKTSNARVVWQGSGSGEATVTAAEVSDVVRRMSEAARASIEKIAAEMDKFLRAS